MKVTKKTRNITNKLQIQDKNPWFKSVMKLIIIKQIMWHIMYKNKTKIIEKYVYIIIISKYNTKMYYYINKYTHYILIYNYCICITKEHKYYKHCVLA